MCMYIWRNEEKDTERERESFKKRERKPPTGPQKPTKEMRASSRFLFFKNQARGCLWH